MPPRPRYQRPDLIRETLNEHRLMHIMLAQPTGKMSTLAGSFMQG